MKMLLMVAALLVWVCGGVMADDFEVPLTVRESMGVERSAAPISGGVPLPKGAFERGRQFALFAEGGTEIPCQVSPLVVETDDTLRWVLLDFQDDLDAGATKHYVLKATRPSATRPGGLRVDDRPERVVIDTGRIELVIAKNKPFALFDARSADGKQIITGGEVSYLQMWGRRGWNDPSKWQTQKLIAGVPEVVKIHYPGPLRVTVEIAGHFDDDPLGAGYRAWITTWAGQSRVAVKYKLCNSNPHRYTAIPVARATVELRLATAAEKVLLGANEPLPIAGDGWIHQGLLLHHSYQDVPGAAKAGSGRKTIWTADGPEDKPAGWIAAGRRQSIFVCDRLFASGPARRLAVAGNRLVLEGIAARFDGPRDEKFRRDRPIVTHWGIFYREITKCPITQGFVDGTLEAQADPVDSRLGHNIVIRKMMAFACSPNDLENLLDGQ